VFETAELGITTSKERYAEVEPRLRLDLLDAQAALREAQFSTIILIGGVDGAGKGETVNLLHEWMDPRYLQAHAFGEPSDEESERPEFWRYIRALPPKGRIGIFFGSWYTNPIVDRVYNRITDAELQVALWRIAAFEQELADDGGLIIKFWFHLSKEAQKRRLKALESDPLTSWRVTKQDHKRLKRYDDFRLISERALRETSTGDAPWTVVEGSDARTRSLMVGEHVLERLTAHLERKKEPDPKRRRRGKAAPGENTILDALDLSKSLGEKAYKRQLEELQGRLNGLYRKMRDERGSAVLAFEGWDAAGKGGTIRRLTGAMDARDYSVIPVAAPSSEERAHHYLWRFWRHMPRAGRVTIFDRSWYGRVLVERVEGFASEAEWRRAYKEISRFEEQLVEHGVVVTKFWVHVSKDEQLRRFEERQKVAHKHFKITEEDFRNREKWDAYEDAANEMIERTSTASAPWVLVEGNDKQYARIKVLRTFCKRLEGSFGKGS
jgi:AMP-polyphosphate phosphotransferase